MKRIGIKGKQCKCSRCGFEWSYKGNRSTEFGFIMCPQCRISRRLSEFMENYEKR